MLSLEATKDPFESLVAFVRQVVNPGQAEINKVGDAVRLGFQENFSGEKEGDGSRWQPLAPKTQVQRQHLGFAQQHPILVRTGSYRASFVQRGGVDHIEEFTSTGDGWSLVVGSRDRRAGILEYGGNTVINGHVVYVPPRPVRFLSETAEQRITNTLEYMLEQIRARTVGK